MIEAFRIRPEKLTILYYPNELAEQKHESVLNYLSLLQPLRRLPFLMRHNYQEKVRQLLESSIFVEEIKKTDSHPLLVDLYYRFF
jgi:hypothetical protein